MKDYEDIIHLPHHVSDRHPRMSALDRAAQFSPFAALTGYEDAVHETARLTGDRFEPDEYQKLILNEALRCLAEGMEITVTYFRPDSKKSGGQYCTAAGTFKKIEETERLLCLKDGTRISLDDIAAIEGEELP